MKNFVVAVAVASFGFTGPAFAQVVDGTRDAAYSAPKSSVAYDPGAPIGNFGSPGTTNHAAGYDIYLSTDATNLFGFIEADRPSYGLQFANLYFDIDPANANGSDLGFELSNLRAFVPGVAGYSSSLSGLNFAASADGTGLEFSIANSLFTSAIPGLTYFAGQEFPDVGDDVVLRLSQSFGYSVAGGATYGSDVLGRVTLGSTGAVPEPATWAMMIAGFGFIGVAMRRRRTTRTFAAA